MRTGLTLEQMAAEVVRQHQTKRDFVADTRQLTFNPDGSISIPQPGKLQLANPYKADADKFKLNTVAHGQVASRLKIPKPYYDRCLNEAPELLSTNVNHWFQKNPEKRLVRTLDGNARAFLSDRFRRLDNYDLLDFLLPEIMNGKEKATFLSTQVTDKKIYLKLIFESVSHEIKPDDKVFFGKTISNSEVGHGSLNIEDFFYRTFCRNGCTFSGGTVRKYHVGRGLYDGANDIAELLSDKTRSATDKAFWMQLKDIWQHSIQPENFQQRMAQLDAARDDKMEKPLQDVVEIVTKEYGLNDEQGKSMLINLAEEGEHNRWGLANSITHLANDEEDYEKASDLEKLGGKIFGLTPAQWRRFAA